MIPYQFLNFYLIIIVHLLFHAISCAIVIFFQFTQSVIFTTNDNKCFHIQSVKWNEFQQ